MKKILTLCLLALSFSLSAQTAYYVKPSAGSSAWNGRENVYTDIQSAVNAAALVVGSENVQVWISAGTYVLSQSLEPKNGVDVIGGFAGNETGLSERSFVGKGENLTILDGNKAIRIISQPGVLSSPACWENLIIQNSRSIQNGGGAWLDSGMTLKGCIIRGNTCQSAGAGAYLNGNASLINCLVVTSMILKGDHKFGGIAVYCKDDARVINCTVADNSGSSIYEDVRGLGIHAAGNSVVGNTIIWGNKTNYSYNAGRQIYLEGEAKAYNCAIAKGNIVITEGDNIEISTSNDGDFEIFEAPYFIASLPGEGGGIVDYDMCDWNIAMESACVDAGRNDLAEGIEYDLNGNKRIINGLFDIPIARVDIGAYEYGEEGVAAELSKVAAVRFYPNPCVETLYRAFESDEPCAIKIIAPSGTVLREATATTSAIDVSFLPTGIYLLQWQTATETGVVTLVKK